MKKPKLVANAKDILTKEYMLSCADTKTYKEVMEETGLKKSTIHKYARLYGVTFKKDAPPTGEEHYKWKGGRYKKKGRGYMVKVDSPNHKYQYRPEHCVLMEQHLGRALEKDEVVHHIDGNPFNNDLDNLIVLNKYDHDHFHMILGSLGIDHRVLTREQVVKIIESKQAIRDFIISLTS